MNAKSTISTDLDADTPPRFTREMAEMGRHVIGDLVLKEAEPKKRGRPRKSVGERKEQVTLRLSPEVITHFRATGEGWQSRIDATLKAHVEADPEGQEASEYGGAASARPPGREAGVYVVRDAQGRYKQADVAAKGKSSRTGGALKRKKA